MNVKVLKMNNSGTNKQLFNNLSKLIKSYSNAVSAKVRGSTIDDNEVKQHTKLSKDWWNVNGPMRALHAYNSLRVQLIRDGLENVGRRGSSPCQPLEGIKILDVGCGGGILSEPLARIGANVTGIDASKELVLTAQEHAKLDVTLSERLNYVHTSVEDYAEAHSSAYDAVVASEIIEHVSNPELFIKACSDIMKPNGSIFITTLNKTPPSWIGKIISEYVLKIVPIGTHDWNKFISPEDTRRILDKYKCRTILVHGSIYNPFKNEWSWTSSTAITYAIHAIKSE